MPNWVYNEIHFYADNPEELKSVIDYISSSDTYFDFNTLIPEPTEEEFDWYSWRICNWGTKWNACDAYIYTQSTEDVEAELTFSTAWSCPEPVLDKLAKLCHKYNIVFTGDFADEDIGYNCGTYYSTSFGEFEIDYFDGGSDRARRHAASLWGWEPREMDEWFEEEEEDDE